MLLVPLPIVCACAGDEVIIPDMIDHPMKRLIAGGVAGSSTPQSALVPSILQPSPVSIRLTPPVVARAGAVSRTATAPFDRLKMLLQAQNSSAMLAGTIRLPLTSRCWRYGRRSPLLAEPLPREALTGFLCWSPAGVATKQLAGGKPAAGRPVPIRPAPDAAARAAAAPEYRGIWNSLKKIYFESGWKGSSLPLSS